MRHFGGILVLVGVLGALYATDRKSHYEPVPQGLTAKEVLSLPAGRWELAQYGGAAMALTGILLVLFPKGR